MAPVVRNLGSAARHQSPVIPVAYVRISSRRHVVASQCGVVPPIQCIITVCVVDVPLVSLFVRLLPFRPSSWSPS